jgi:hypothetical protein
MFYSINFVFDINSTLFFKKYMKNVQTFSNKLSLKNLRNNFQFRDFL